jgi:hypothetical protein
MESRRTRQWIAREEIIAGWNRAVRDGDAPDDRSYEEKRAIKTNVGGIPLERIAMRVNQRCESA